MEEEANAACNKPIIFRQNQIPKDDFADRFTLRTKQGLVLLHPLSQHTICSIVVVKVNSRWGRAVEAGIESRNVPDGFTTWLFTDTVTSQNELCCSAGPLYYWLLGTFSPTGRVTVGVPWKVCEVVASRTWLLSCTGSAWFGCTCMYWMGVCCIWLLAWDVSPYCNLCNACVGCRLWHEINICPGLMCSVPPFGTKIGTIFTRRCNNWFALTGCNSFGTLAVWKTK